MALLVIVLLFHGPAPLWFTYPAASEAACAAAGPGLAAVLLHHHRAAAWAISCVAAPEIEAPPS